MQDSSFCALLDPYNNPELDAIVLPILLKRKQRLRVMLPKLTELVNDRTWTQIHTCTMPKTVALVGLLPIFSLTPHPLLLPDQSLPLLSNRECSPEF